MKFIDVIDCAGARIAGASDYQWECYGPNAHILDFADVDNNVYSNCIYDKKTYEVYEIVVEVPKHPQVYRWINENYRKAYFAEVESRGIDSQIAWDDVNYINVDTEGLILEYLLDIGEMNYSNVLPTKDFTMSKDVFIVKLDVRYSLEVEASSMDEAVSKARHFQSTMPSGWGEGANVTWMDTEVVKETVTRDINIAGSLE